MSIKVDFKELVWERGVDLCGKG